MLNTAYLRSAKYDLSYFVWKVRQLTRTRTLRCKTRPMTPSPAWPSHQPASSRTSLSRVQNIRRRSELEFKTVFRIRIRTDPHKEMPPGSRSAWTDADPDPGGRKA